MAFGEKARTEVRQSVKTLNVYHDLPVAVIAERPVKGATFIPFKNPGNGARRAKLSIPEVAPVDWTHILYLDADTRIRGNLEAGFLPPEDGWDMAICYSKSQYQNALWHIPDKEKEFTYNAIYNPFPLQLQGGVWWIDREAVRKFFEVWRMEWERYRGPDQGALLRALHENPLKVWIMGRPFNDGYLLEHRYGMADIKWRSV